jgi:NTP pyrophosphatase (non-canonical NTP hydrolase)
MSELNRITQALISFRDERDWQQFHDSKNLATAISIEASELNELFLWKNSTAEVESVDKERLAEELADILSYSFLLAKKHNLNIEDIILNKIKKNGDKYPIDKAKGTSKKYNEL